MKITGIIAEYNPFHNGHEYQLKELRKNCDGIIAVMSGHFMQRGDIAVTDKWTRAKAAVLNGCDLVLELPVCYSLNSAENFARGGVELLEKLNVVDYLGFGSECGDTDKLISAAKIMINESSAVSDNVKKYADTGMSYPAAYAKAYEGIVDAELLTEPNNILAIEYIKAIIRLDSEITPVTIKRIGASHDCDITISSFASASHIRDLIKSNSDYAKYVPLSAYNVYESADMAYDISRLDSFISGTLRTCPVSRIENTYDVSEGLHNRIRAAAMNTSDFNSLCSAVKTKRYTMSRIRRVVLAAALNLPPAGEITYARVLAMNDNGRNILKEIKKNSNIEIITKTADARISPMLRADLSATDIFSLAAKDAKKGGRDFTTSPVVV